VGNQARDRVMTRKFFSEAQTPWLLSKRVTPDREACSGPGVFLCVGALSTSSKTLPVQDDALLRRH
jgi:hypothetical protein